MLNNSPKYMSVPSRNWVKSKSNWSHLNPMHNDIFSNYKHAKQHICSHFFTLNIKYNILEHVKLQSIIPECVEWLCGSELDE